MRNTSSTGEFFFLDPRRDQQADVTLPPIFGQNHIDLPEDTASTSPPVYTVPTHVSTLTQHFSSTVPADDYLEFADGNPGPYLFAGTSGVNTISAAQLAFGIWFTDVGEVGPFQSAAPAGTADLSLTAHMQPFDDAVTSGTGDFWQTALGGSAGNAVFIPAGGTATIPVTITPTAKPGTVVRGTLYVDTWNNLFGQGSELAGIPYSYTVR